VTVLFADVVGSTRIAERLGAEAWHRTLDRFFKILVAGVHRFEGTVNQFTGDGIMALFGAPIAHEDHARRACHTALHLLDELGEFAAHLHAREGLDFAVRIGLNSGDVVVGRIGDDLRMDYTAQGHTVSLAARVEEIAEPGTAYLTEHTARLVEGFFNLRDRGAPSMKGVSASVHVYELAGIGPLRTRLDVSRARGFSRLVGRDQELAWLDRLLEQAVASGGQVVAVAAEAGAGKSRLCLEFVERCRARGIAVHEAHCPAHGRSVPLLAIRALLRSFFALGEEDPGATVRRRVAARLLALDGTGDALPTLLALLGASEAEGAGEELTPETRRGELMGFIRRFLAAPGGIGGTVLLLDDVHAIDAESDDLLADLAETILGTPTLLLVNFRAEYEARWIGKPFYHQLPLAPLERTAVGTLLESLLGSDPSVSALSDVIRERAGGNPFFVEEAVQALAAAGSLRGERGAYRLAAPIASLDVPASIQSLLAARIDRLGDEEKHVLQTAAVIGKQFALPLLERVADLGARDLMAALTVLRETDLVHEVTAYPQAQLAFRHPLTQEVAYGSQLGERRAQLHGAVARALAELQADRLGEYAAFIAHHWEAAGMRYEAARWRRRAALRVASIRLGGRRRSPVA
jgi:class 3 adenylate cyclase